MTYIDIDGETYKEDQYLEFPSVSVIFDDPWEYDPDGERPEGTERLPDTWCNAAGVITRDDSVQVWISTGDPRGAFTMEIRCLPDGELVMHIPDPEGILEHEDTERLHPGTLIIKRTKV